MSVIPARASRSMLWSIIGRPPTGSSGLGVWSVRGRRRSPLPPAMRSALTGRRFVQAVKSKSPVRRPSASTSGRSFIPAARIRAISCGVAPGRSERKERFITAVTSSSSERPAMSARRMSPSVTVPATRPRPSSTTRVITPPERALSLARASVTEAVMWIICLSVIFESVVLRHDKFGYLPVEGGVEVNRA